MLTYEKYLLADCEKWFRENYNGLHKNFNLIHFESAYQPNGAGSRSQESFSSGYQLTLGTGPWKSLYIKFKQPGKAVSVEEKYALGQLRDQGHRVAIVRYVEDFKTLINSYVIQRSCIRY